MTTIGKLICVALTAVALTACSSSKKTPGTESAVGGEYGAESTGLGYDSSFPGARAGQVNASTGERYNTVYFGYDQSSIEPRYMSIIEANAHYLKAHPNAVVRLEGHTDPRGSREYNIGLGQRRGNAVEQHLHQMGVPSNQIVVVSYGKEKLATVGDTEADYRLDRRVEIAYEVTK